MKTNFIIVWALILSLTGAFALQAISQEHDKCPSVVPRSVNPNKILLGDETTLNYCKTEAIIICDNETIFKKIHETHSQLFKRFTCSWIFTGVHLYKHYVIYIDKGDARILINWAKRNL
jgi:hypothetical protein